jgi:hypothetical protein
MVRDLAPDERFGAVGEYPLFPQGGTREVDAQARAELCGHRRADICVLTGTAEQLASNRSPTLPTAIAIEVPCSETHRGPNWASRATLAKC